MRLFELDFNQEMRPGDHENFEDDEFENAVNLVKARCGKFLKVIAKSNKFLYRGFDSSLAKKSIITGKPQDFRQPVFSTGDEKNQKIAAVCNALLKKAGFKALRSNSLFCSSSSGNAMDWGKTYIIFFLDGYSFGYSKVKTGVPAPSYDYPTDGMAPAWSDQRSVNIINMTIDKSAAEEFVGANEFSKANLSWAMGRNPMNIDYDVWVRGNFIAFDYKKYGDELKRLFL